MARKIKVAALIVAAGRGERFGGGTPKQYAMLSGKPVLRHTTEAFLSYPDVDAVQVVIHQDHKDLYTESVTGFDILPLVIGGDTRQASVYAGLKALEPLAPELVLIHDAARPFASAGLISRVIAALEGAPAVIPSLTVTDTLKQVRGGRVEGTVPREGLEAVQTPQGFRFREILELHRTAVKPSPLEGEGGGRGSLRATEAGICGTNPSPGLSLKGRGESFTDDAALCEIAGLNVVTVPGDTGNFKITTQDDMERAEKMMVYETRTGSGYDVHPFEPGEYVTLCGVKVPHTHKLKGHSDADAGLHALTDALLGAIGAGDIGQHFPPSDQQWKGADSGKFVEHAVKLIRQKGGSVVNADITIICERPKVGPHREAMQKRTAELLGIAPDRVNIKATTTEQLGFTGRGEGLAAQAVANVRLPA